MLRSFSRAGRWSARFGVVAALAVGSLAASTIAYASTPETLPAPSPRQSMTQSGVGVSGVDRAEIEKLASQLLAGFSKDSAGVKSFDFQKALDAGSTVEQAQKFATGFILAGGQITHVPAKVTITQPSSEQVTKFKQALGDCVGRNQAWNDFWGRHAEIDTCAAQTIIAALDVGTALETLLAIVAGMLPDVGPALAGIAAALLGIGSAVIRYCAANGTGITLHVTVVPWCGSQT